jgi:ADP-ribose pyrophosphatase YjhB (NUDIX family)
VTVPSSPPDSSRAYPARPVAGVGAVIVTVDRQVILIRRGQAPLSGAWSLPGGVLELGETLAAAVAREVREETGLDVAVGPLIDCFEHIARDDDGRIRYHYVIADFLCRVTGGQLGAASDARDVRAVDPFRLDEYALAEPAREMIRKACRMAGLADPDDAPPG